ncbi:MAG: MFS transporter [Quadrisphaera sp.]
MRAPATVVGLVVASTALSTAPTPLFPLYAARDGLTPTATTAVFAVFAAGVVTGLVAAGRSSDRWGHRRVLRVAAVVEVAAAVVLALVPGAAGLVAGRVLCGLGVGVLAATASVAVRELASDTGPAARRRWAAAAGAMSMAGLGLGPLLAGALAQMAPAPLHLVYAVLALVLAAATAALRGVPETAPTPSTDLGAVLARVRDRRSASAAPALLAFTSFAVTGFYGALAPEALAAVGSPSGPLVAGAAIGSVFLAGALAPLLVRASLPVGRRTGCAAVALGTAAAAVALIADVFWLLFTAAPVAGAGSGLLFAGAVHAATQAEPAARAAAARAVFVAAYSGLAVPVLGLGLLLRVVPLSTAVVPHAVLVLALLAAGACSGRVARAQEHAARR